MAHSGHRLRRASTSEIRSDSVRVHLPYIHQVIADHGISHQYACWHRLQPMAMQTCCAAFACRRSETSWRSGSRGSALVALIVLVAEEVFRRSRLIARWACSPARRFSAARC